MKLSFDLEIVFSFVLGVRARWRGEFVSEKSKRRKSGKIDHVYMNLWNIYHKVSFSDRNNIHLHIECLGWNCTNEFTFLETALLLMQS